MRRRAGEQGTQARPVASWDCYAAVRRAAETGMRVGFSDRFISRAASPQMASSKDTKTAIPNMLINTTGYRQTATTVASCDADVLWGVAFIA